MVIPEASKVLAITISLNVKFNCPVSILIPNEISSALAASIIKADAPVTTDSILLLSVSVNASAPILR